MRQESPNLPVRTVSPRAVTLQRWHTRNRQLLERVLAGLWALDPPARCRADITPILGYAHAFHVRDIHRRHHGCPRYVLADEFLTSAQR
ncbi:hypothetical protein ACFWPH_00380 [Nocardia sp. NPDC058499]|uniref:hypothetical protein n=1 Tax=Nocardia sp. NPDC058499 TaxID=3346530 RepID=UPI003666306A